MIGKNININWSNGYGELKSGKYRLVKKVVTKENTLIDETRTVYLYAEFSIN